MKSVTILISLLLVGCANAADPDQLAAHSSTTIRGVTYESVLTFAMVSKPPKWNSAVEPLPLQPNAAEKIALDYVRQSLKIKDLSPPAEWRLFETSLVRVGRLELWYYAISVIWSTPGTGGRDSVIVYVLLSGELVPIRQSPSRDDPQRLK
jgi:hypothetical protein